MLQARNPSRNLHAPKRGRVTGPEDLGDIEVTVVEPAVEPSAPAPGQPKVNGRTARFNVALPAQQDPS